jgi:hypothetical protein
MNANGGKAMIGFSRASNVVAEGGSAGGYGAIALATTLLLGSPIPALSQVAPPDPEDSHVWAGCVLDAATVAALQADVNVGIEAELDSDIEIAFVVVYSLNNDNDGQPVTGGTTGPVICTNPEVVDTPSPTTQTTNIGSADDTVTILDAEEAFLLRYQFEDPPEDIEKRVCHTVDNNTDCFLIVPAPPVEP